MIEHSLSFLKISFMRFFPLVALLISSGLLAAPLQSAKKLEEGKSRYVVTFADLPLLEHNPNALRLKSKAARELQSQQESEAKDRQLSVLRGAAKSLKLASIKPVMSTVWTTNAVSVDLTAEQAQQLASQSGVAAVELNFDQQLHSDAGSELVAAPQLWNTGSRGEGVVVGIIDSGITPVHPSFADIASDGFNHTNPRAVRYGLCNQVVGAARCNDKLIGMWDFTQEGGRDGVDVDGHGSHVASTAIGNPLLGKIGAPGNEFNLPLSGVAPRANVISYKSCIRGTNDSPPACPNDATIQAIEQATRDQVAVINYSIGGNAFDPFSALNSSNPIRAMFNARAAGVAIAVSAGNDGPLAGTVKSPSNAPWVLSVANTTHDRRFVNKLDILTSSNPPPQTSFEGASITSSLFDAPLVLGERFGNAGCGQGEDINPPYNGLSNPFQPNTFSGQIVVCVRGNQARLAKGVNVKLSGAAGMILINTSLEGESIVNDEHVLPAVHLGEQDGNRLVAFLRSTNNARGRISGTTNSRLATFGDLLNSSSSRGPIAQSFLKPDISAPGTGIFAANTNTGIANLSGTSMSSPHVAGALALLKQRHPNWGPEQLESAIRTSAVSGLVRITNNTPPASPLLAGHGRLNVFAADASLIYFPASNDHLRSSASNPTALNLPSLYAQSCVESCSFQRRVAAMPELDRQLNLGLSLVDAPPELGARFSSNSIRVGPTGSVSFNVDFSVNHPNLLGRTISANVRLAGGGQVVLIPVVLNVSPGAIPSRIDVTMSSERGFQSIPVSGLVGLKRPTANITALQKSTVVSSEIVSDTSVTDPYNPGGTFTQTVSSVPVGGNLYAEISASADVDLFVGRDVNNDGIASAGEVLCRENGPSSTESCLVTADSGGNYWIHVQNASAITTTARIQYASLAATASSTGSDQVAILPGRISNGERFNLDLALELGGSFTGEEWFGIVSWRADDATANIMARSVLRVARVAGANNESLVLHPNAVVTIGSGIGEPAKNRIAFDVPLNARQIRIAGTASGTLNAQIFRAPNGETSVTQAPETGSIASSVFGSGSALIALNNPSPGRYYLVLSNPQAATQAASARVALTVVSDSLSALDPQLYYNPARSGHGLVITRARDDAQIIWYTFDQNNQPTWYWFFPNGYFANNPGAVSGPLLRYTWDGNQVSVAQTVGTATLTRTGDRQLHFAFTLSGQSGSETMVLLGSSQCSSGPSISGTDYTGAWYMPSLSGWGASIHSANNLEFAPFFVYDGQGQPRWLLGFDDRPNALFGGSASTRQLFQYSGFCPTCVYREPTRAPAGDYQLVLDAAPKPNLELSGRINLTANFLAPLSGSFAQSGDFGLLTAKRGCGQ